MHQWEQDQARPWFAGMQHDVRLHWAIMNKDEECEVHDWSHKDPKQSNHIDEWSRAQRVLSYFCIRRRFQLGSGRCQWGNLLWDARGNVQVQEAWQFFETKSTFFCFLTSNWSRKQEQPKLWQCWLYLGVSSWGRAPLESHRQSGRWLPKQYTSEFDGSSHFFKLQSRVLEQRNCGSGT